MSLDLNDPVACRAFVAAYRFQGKPVKYISMPNGDIIYISKMTDDQAMAVARVLYKPEDT